MSCSSVLCRCGAVMLAVLMMCSCVSVCPAPDYSCGGDDVVEVKFSLAENGSFSRSSAGVADDEVSSLKIMAYSDGVLMAEAFYSDFGKMSLPLELGRSYNLYALAGMGDPEVPENEGALKDFRYVLPGYDKMADGMPMCWHLENFVPDEASSVQISLTRLMTMVTLGVDPADTGLEISYAMIRQAPMSVLPFSPDGSRAEDGDVSDGDIASAEDVERLGSGGQAVFYVLENMQGVLLPGNTDPMLKVPSEIGGHADVCTYIEVGCIFPDGYEKEGTACYRLYLGEDETSDFNLLRNRRIDVSLSLTGHGLDVADSWKIRTDYIQHASGMVMDSESVDMIIGKSMVLVAEIHPYDAVEAEVIWESTDESVAVVDVNGCVTAVGEGTCRIRAVCKGRPAVFSECAVVVRDSVVSIEIIPSQVHAVLGEDGDERYSEFRVNALYASGRSEDVTDGCGYMSDSGSASVSAGGVVVHSSEGKTDISVTYQGVSSVLRVVTEGLAAVGVEFEHEAYVVALGDSPVVRYRVLFNDGTASAYVAYQLAQGYGWSGNGVSVEDYNIAELTTGGRVNTFMMGQTSMTVSVWSTGLQSNLTATASLRVDDAYLVSVSAGATPMFYDGCGGPHMTGLYSDGSSRDITGSAVWSTSDANVIYNYASGLAVEDESLMIEGVTIVTFTGEYQGMKASATSVYGKWIKDVRFYKEQESAMYDRYRVMVVYDDFTTEFVRFRYQVGSGGGWTQSEIASESGVLVLRSVPATVIRAVTVEEYYDYTGHKSVRDLGY